MSISRTFGRFTSWIVDRPGWTYLLLIVLSGIAFAGHFYPQQVREFFKPRPVAASVANAPATAVRPKKRPDVEAVDLTGSDAVLVIESDRVFTPSGAAALRHMVQAVEDLPYIRNVLWMDRVPVLNIFGLREPLFPKSDASTARFDAARDKALSHPLVAGQLLSPDGRTVIVLVNFDWLKVTSDEDCTTHLKQVAEAALAEYPDVKFTVGVTGRVPIYLTIKQTQLSNRLKFQIIGYGVVLVMAAILFRGVVAVLIVSLGPCLGVFWTLGILNLFDAQDNPFNDVVLPVLLSLIGLADGVHMVVQIRHFRAQGMSEKDAARAGLEEVGLACFLTATTTSIGFWSLTLARHEIVREFGWTCVLGAILSVISVVTIIPLACSSILPALRKVVQVLPLPRLLAHSLNSFGSMHQTESYVEQHLHRITYVINLVLRRPKPVALIGIAVTILCAAISLTLYPDDRRTSYLPANAEATKALHRMDEALGGLEFSEVNIRWPEAVESDSAEVLKVVKEVDDLLRSEKSFGTPISIRSLIDALPGDSPTEARASMLELLPPPLKRAFYKPEDHLASVTFRVQDIGIARYSKVFQRVETGLKTIVSQHPGFEIWLSGSAVGRWRDVYQITVDMGTSLGSESIIIVALLAIVFRSIRFGLIAMVPNVFPLAICGAWMVFTGQPLEVVTVVSFTICLGIAVDDTIHFLTRYEEEVPRSSSRQDAIRRAFQGVGSSMIMTTLVLIVGLSTVTLSDMRDQRIFATIGLMTMVTAIVGDLIILPAILACYARPVPGELKSEGSNQPIGESLAK